MFAAALVLGTGLLLNSQTAPVVASDHDDGETQIKARNLNLTDLYVFREDWQSGVAADAANLIIVMNTNPRSLPRQQYFFNTEAVYNIHVGRQTNRDTVATGQEDMRFEFRFGAPNAQNQQPYEMLTFFGGGSNAVRSTGGLTQAAAPLLGAAPTTGTTQLTVRNTNDVTVFAGLREDPFFFDVEGTFRFRAGAATAGGPAPAGIGAANGLATTTANALDFAAGYNVNSIVMRVPISVLQDGNAAATTFDVWESISLPSELSGRQ